MAQNRRQWERNVSGAGGEVSMAHAACLDLHHYLVRLRSAELDLLKEKGSARLMHDGCLRGQHGCGTGLFTACLDQWWPPPANV